MKRPSSNSPPVTPAPPPRFAPRREADVEEMFSSLDQMLVEPSASLDDDHPGLAAFTPGAQPDVAAVRSTPTRAGDPAAAVPRQPRLFARVSPLIVVLMLIVIGQAAAIVVLLRRSGAPGTPPTTGTLVVDTRPGGAKVVIDGIERGVTPLTIVLAAGPHRAEVIHGGGRREIKVNVAGGSTVSQYLELARLATGVAAGAIEVRSRPTSALVSVDGQPRGSTPVVIRDVPPGVHQVVLTAGPQQVRESVTVEPGGTARLSARLPSVDRGSGWLAVSSAIPLSILEDGRVIGTTAAERVMVRAGRHAIELVNEPLGFRSRRTVDVGAGKTVVVTPELPRGLVSVNALPWAEVWVRDRKLGETPLANVSLPIGTYQVVFKHPSLGERRQDVTVGTGTPARVSVDMRR
jgi:hypothetical protein